MRPKYGNPKRGWIGYNAGTGVLHRVFSEHERSSSYDKTAVCGRRIGNGSNSRWAELTEPKRIVWTGRPCKQCGDTTERKTL